MNNVQQRDLVEILFSHKTELEKKAKISISNSKILIIKYLE